MTNKEKLEKIRSEVIWYIHLRNEGLIIGSCGNFEKLLKFIDSMQEEPITSVWHDASEKPKEGSWICVSFASRDLSTFLYEDGKIHNNYVDIEMIGCKWAYPEDLLKL